MLPLSKPWSLSYSLLFLLLIVGCVRTSSTTKEQVQIIVEEKQPIAIEMDTFAIVTVNRLEMTKQYSKQNYGIADYRLKNPSMIVIHYTAIPSLERTLNYFKSDSLDVTRKRIVKKSALNVGVHYVVDKDGAIYSLLPDSIMGRHLIGYNHIALGIENVSKDSSDLTTAQIASNVKLIKYLSDKHDSIRYLIGHCEYDNAALPHYKHLLVMDPSYAPYKKGDPGLLFLEAVRNNLKLEYDLVFEK